MSRWTKGMAAAVALSASVSLAHAQSTDMNDPTRLVSGDIRGVGEESERQYHYSFVGGPGEVVLVLDVNQSSDGAWAAVQADLLDRSFETVLTVRSGSGQEIERVTLHREQSLILQLTVEAEGIENYRVRLTGAVHFADSSASTATASTARAGTPPAADSRLACIPTSGMLRIEMEDGSAQEINLARGPTSSTRR